MEHLVALAQSGRGEPWNKGKLVGQKAPLQLKEIWAIRIRLQLAERTRELALFNLAVDSKLLSCDRPVRFEITEQTRDSLSAWIHLSILRSEDAIGLNSAAYGTNTFRRTKNLRAVQLLLDHSKLESTVRYLGIEVDDALEMAEQAEV